MEAITKILAEMRFQAVSKVSSPLELLDSQEGGYVLGIACAMLLPALRGVLRFAVFEKGDAKNSVKESFWKAVFYASVVALGVFVSTNEQFLFDTKHFWLGCTRFPPCDFDISRGVRLLYVLELGFYLQAVPYLLLWEVRRKDFLESFAHHIATLGLIIYSYQVNFVKVGVAVFLCHDVNDVFLELAKMARYAERKAASTALFVVFLLSWILSRLIYFPLWLIAKPYGISPHPHHEIFLSLLGFLFVLHLYWSYLIVRVLVRQVTQGEIDDVREDHED